MNHFLLLLSLSFSNILLSLISLKNLLLTSINYRPISNLTILSKTLERVVSKQLSSFLTTNNTLCTLKSAYIPNKSTETAITRVTTNILCDLNNTDGTILVLLDLSSAFDTIDHSLLISRLANIGIAGMYLNGLRHIFLI